MQGLSWEKTAMASKITVRVNNPSFLKLFIYEKGYFYSHVLALLSTYSAVWRLNGAEWFSIFSRTMAKSDWIEPVLISLLAMTMTGEYLSSWTQWSVFVCPYSLCHVQKPVSQTPFSSIHSPYFKRHCPHSMGPSYGAVLLLWQHYEELVGLNYSEDFQ